MHLFFIKKDFGGGQENTDYLDQDMLMYSLKDQDLNTVLKSGAS